MTHTASSTNPSSPIAAQLRVGKLCVAIQAGSATEMIARATAALADSKFLELRLDFLAKPIAALPLVKEFLAQHRDVAVIATCRRQPNGGHFTQSLTAEFEVLSAAAEAGCQIVDLEIESAEEATPAQLDRLRSALRAAHTALLISYHDFTRTEGLRRAADRIAAFQPDFVKVVSTARTLADNLAVLQLIEERSAGTRIVGIAMGEEGLPSRVLGLRAGAAFTFAASSEGEGTAPGQVTARTLRDLYRAEQLGPATRIFGVAGNPISHSLSPLLHNTAYRSEAIDAVMLPLKVHNLNDFLTLARELPLSGAAVTMPLKLEVLPYLAQMDPLTTRIGACNTLRISADGKIAGFNTDVTGILRPLQKRLSLKGAKVAVLGAGGAARAAIFGLADQGAEVFIVNRTHEAAVKLAKEANVHALKHEQFATSRFDVLINSTPCGMRDSKQPLPIAENELNAGLVFDMVYNPLETPLIKLAKARGIATISGIEMFVQQGIRQFEIWTGKSAPEAELMRVVEAELRRRG